ncbi:DUF2157 domain-containing protein [Terricaulis sp.]|uniref:DUF2157 domain-containing protein n=1 Tax=Terricaulis sp. TaxID=2768686 RepID=UPI003784C38B
MAAYKDRVKQDLDRWIAAGLVSSEKRGEILATIPDARRLEAATALAWVGSVLLGIAIISFIAANWSDMPRIARFALVLLGFALASTAGAWASHKRRPILSNISLMLASLIFAAAIGLTGQIFDIAADPQAAFYAAGIVGFALALAGRSTGAASVGLALIALGDFTGRQWFSENGGDAPWMLAAAPLGAFLALRWGSSALAHISALAIIYCFGWFAARSEPEAATLLFLSILMGAMAAGARHLFGKERPFSGIFYGWFTAGAVLFFAIMGYLPWFGDAASKLAGIAHRLVWLGISGALIAVGRFDRHILVSSVGVVSMIIAIGALLADLEVDLLASAAVFLVCAVIALVAGLALRNRSKA